MLGFPKLSRTPPAIPLPLQSSFGSGTGFGSDRIGIMRPLLCIEDVINSRSLRVRVQIPEHSTVWTPSVSPVREVHFTELEGILTGVAAFVEETVRQLKYIEHA